MYFYFVNWIKAEMLGKNVEQARKITLAPLESLGASLLARSAVGVVLMPFAVVKTRMEVCWLFVCLCWCVCACVGLLLNIERLSWVSVCVCVHICTCLYVDARVRV